MNPILIQKIKQELNERKVFDLKYFPHHNGCEIDFGEVKNIDLIDFFKSSFLEWWYEELSNYLVEKDAFGEEIYVNFLQENFLIADIKITSSSKYEDVRNTIKEIITENIIQILSKKINQFDIDLLEFEFEYKGNFTSFTIYYNYKTIQINYKELKIIKNEIESIIKEWKGNFFGKDYSKIETVIISEIDSDIECIDYAWYGFRIEE